GSRRIAQLSPSGAAIPRSTEPAPRPAPVDDARGMDKSRKRVAVEAVPR
ncbi:MAG: hypothetical protein QOH17_4938, partial [Pseudonocardiales bacterium]|nr:hypothetical protein [Pseudonocardiales bacterium]